MTNRPLKAPARVETPRLVLEAPRPGDAAAIFQRYASDPEVTRFLSWPRHQSIADTRAFLRFSALDWKRWPAGPYLIRTRERSEIVGATGFAFEGARDAVTGYVLAKDAWGLGYATEALTAIVGVARTVGVTRLSAFCHAEHLASRRVLEKCGFTRDDSVVRRAEFPNLAPGVQQGVLCYVLVLAPHQRQSR